MRQIRLSFMLFGIAFLSGMMAFSQSETFRTGILMHHEVGTNIYGPNGSNTSVPAQVAHYNLVHGYTGAQAVNLAEVSFPVNNDNEWATWHTIFEEAYPEGICLYCATNPIIMIKSGFAASHIQTVGMAIDTLTPAFKSLYNYKRHWRHFMKVMQSHPEHFFVVWTNPPLVQDQTNATEAYITNWFCKWAKDTLAAGLDPVFGAFPPNILVFDYFHKVATTQGYLMPSYAVSPYDSHPNAAATELIAPQLVSETFGASIAYETSLITRNITGKLFYDNIDSTPLANVRVRLKLACCTVVDSTYTDSNGNFTFANLSPAYYTIEPVINYPWGGVNSDDALIILKRFVGMVNLTGIRFEAANLDENHISNASDALYAARRLVGLINCFPV